MMGCANGFGIIPEVLDNGEKVLLTITAILSSEFI